MKWFHFEILVVALGLTIQRIPQLFSGVELGYTLPAITLIPFWVVIWRNLAKPLLRGLPIVTRMRRTDRLTYFFLFLLIPIGLVRGYLVGSLDGSFLARHLVWWSTLFLFVFAIFSPKRKDDQVDKLAMAALFSVAIYVSGNVLLLTAGVTHAAKGFRWDTLGEGSISSLFGISMPRISFPMSSGPGDFAILSAVCCIFCVVIVARAETRRVKFLGLLLSLIGFYALLRADSRMAFIALLLTLLLYLVVLFGGRRVRRLVQRYFRYIPLFMVAIPVLALTVAAVIGKSEMGEVLGRSGSSENFASLSNRDVVWGNVWAELRSFEIIHMIGFGSRGQVASGVGAANAAVFGDNYLMNVDEKTAHNFVLQTILDHGYLGLVFHIYVFLLLLRRAAELPDPRLRDSVFFTAIILVLGGSAQVVPSIYTNEPFTYFVLILGASLSRRGSSSLRYWGNS